MLIDRRNVVNFLVALSFLVCTGAPAAQAATDEKQKLAIAVEEMRSLYRSLIPSAGTGEEVRAIKNIATQANEPTRTIPLRIYFPSKAAEQTNLPIFLFMHGGGFVSGDLETHDVLLRAISNGAGCIVVSVDYRLAPENPFPAGLEDGYAALLWSKDNAATFGGDSAKIIVGGDSAGGNLTAALAILSRDRKGPKILGQWLMYPTLSNKMDTESWAKLGETHFPTREVNTMIITAYVPDGKTPYEPLIAPLWANLENLPPALVQAGGFDPLSDENKDFVQKMQQSGNTAEFLFYPEFQHGFIQFYQDGKNFPGAETALRQGISWLQKVFYSGE